MLSSIARGWKAKTSSSSPYSSLVGLSMSTQKTHCGSFIAARSDSVEGSFDVRPSAYLMYALTMADIFACGEAFGYRKACDWSCAEWLPRDMGFQPMLVAVLRSFRRRRKSARAQRP